MKTNKKAVSEMVAYVLLIVIVMAIGSLVYAWVVFQMPKDSAKCPDDLSLIIKDYNCSAKVLDLEVQNKGLFDIFGYYIRAANQSDRGRIIMLGEIGIIGEPGRIKFNPKLSSGESIVNRFDYKKYGNLTSIEIEPYLLKDKQIVMCKEGLLIRNLNCN